MAVRYIRVRPVADLFAPAIRGTGTVAIVGDATAGPANSPQTFTDAAAAAAMFPGNLGTSIGLAFQQSPGPPLVIGLRTAAAGGGPDWAAALSVVGNVDAQLVVLA